MTLVFTETVETNLQGGQPIINPFGKEILRAVSPRNSDVSPMEVIRPRVIPMVFTPVDKIFRISFPIARDLPYAIVLGVAFTSDHQSTISFRQNEDFRPATESSWVPFFSHTTNAAMSSKHATAAWNAFCAVQLAVNSAQSLQDPIHAIPKCVAEARRFLGSGGRISTQGQRDSQETTTTPRSYCQHQSECPS